ncbi:hypothetical protein D3C85_1284980 [compost metagenome]
MPVLGLNAEPATGAPYSEHLNQMRLCALLPVLPSGYRTIHSDPRLDRQAYTVAQAPIGRRHSGTQDLNPAKRLGAQALPAPMPDSQPQ